MKELNDLQSKRDEYDKESQMFIDSLTFIDNEISEINEMKRTSGWKLMDKKIRQELQQRITDLIKDDLKIQTLLALLRVADTKSLNKTLADEVAKLLPEK